MFWFLDVEREAEAQRVLEELENVADESSRLSDFLKEADRDQVLKPHVQ